MIGTLRVSKSCAFLGLFLVFAVLGAGSTWLHQHGHSGLHAHPAMQGAGHDHYSLPAAQATGGHPPESAIDRDVACGVTTCSVTNEVPASDGVLMGIPPARPSRPVSTCPPPAPNPTAGFAHPSSRAPESPVRWSEVRVPPERLKGLVAAILLTNHALLI